METRGARRIKAKTVRRSHRRSARQAQDLTAQQQVEDRLREREQQLRLFVEHCPAAIAMFDRNMRYIMVSRRWLTDYRLKKTEIIGRSHYEVFPEIPQRWKEVHRRCLDGAVEKNDADEFPRADGSIDWVRWEIRPWHKGTDEIGGIIILSEVITARKQAEMALRESEAKLRLLAENIQDVFWISTPVIDRITYVSPAYEKVWGRTCESLYQHPLSFVEAVHPEDQGRVLATLQDHVQGSWNIEYRIIRPDGAMRWILDRGFPIRDERGELVLMCGVAKDITERKQTELALREKEEQFRETFYRAGVGKAQADPWTGRFLRVNPAFCKFLGYTEEELLQKTFFEITLPEERKAEGELYPRLRRGEIPTYTREKRYVRKDGVLVWGHLSVTMLFNRNGRANLVTAVIQDITESRQMKEMLRKLSLQLNRAEEEERRRIARELHDSTGQKLAALAMSVEALQDATNASSGKPEQRVADCLAMIEECAREIRTLSYRLHPPLLDELGLAAAIRNYIEGFSKRSGLRVTLDAPPDPERLPEAVELALFRVAQESLGNVHRHAGASSARIRLMGDAEQVILEVSDQGRGMTSEKLDASQSGREGTGVGIAGMRERLRLLGGRLEIESGKHGTTVRAVVPIAECGLQKEIGKVKP